MRLYSIHFHFTLFFLDVFFRPFRPYKYAWKALYLCFKAVMFVIMVARSGCTFRNIHRHFNIAYSRDSYPWLYASLLSVMTGLTWEEEEYFDDAHEPLATEENLNNTHPYINHKFLSLTMNAYVMGMYQNDPDTYIHDTEEFHRYISWLLSEHKVKSIQTSIIKTATSRLDGESNSHIFANITMFTYIRPVKCNVKILNSSKDPSKVIGIVIIKIPKSNIIITFWPTYYIAQNRQYTINETALKHYNQFRSVKTEALWWL